MERAVRKIRRLLSGIIFFLLLIQPPPVAAESILARLSFWVPTERVEEFADVYGERIAPLLLEKRGLTASSEVGRATVDSVFSRLFSFSSPGAFLAGRDALWDDPAWKALLSSLGRDFRTGASRDSIRCEFTLYQCPAGRGRSRLAGAGTRQGEWLNFGIQDGLPNSVAGRRGILQDREGYLWFLAGFQNQGEGVVRYDGATFTHFLPADGLIDSLTAAFQDRAGRLWFGSYGSGIVRYDGQNFVHFTPADGLADGPIWSMAEDGDGRLWFGTDRGLTSYNARRDIGSAFTTFTAADGLANYRVNVLGVDSRGDLWLWFATEGWRENSTGDGWPGGSLARYDGRIFSVHTTPAAFTRGPVWGMAEDADGRLWFGTVGGLVCYDARQEVGRQESGDEFTTFTAADGLANDRVNVLGVDGKGDLWFSTGLWEGGEWKGVCLVRYSGRTAPLINPASITIFTSEDGLGDQVANVMLEDRAGDLWFESSPGGLARYDGREFTTFTTENGLPQNQMMGMMEDREGYVWVGSFAGLSRYEGAHVSTFTLRDGLPSSYVFSALQDRAGDLWFGTSRGLVRYDGRELSTATTEDGTAIPAYSIVEDKNGHLWCGGWGKLMLYDREVFVDVPLDFPLFGTFNNQGMAMDRNGHLWLATREDGVRRFDGRDLARFTAEDGLVSDEVQSVVRDRDGNIWVGTKAGVSRYDGEKFTSFTREDGLGFDSVVSIAEDGNGYIWFGGEGVCRYDPRRDVDRQEVGSAFTTFTPEDGLKPGPVGSILPDRNGHLWFGIYGSGIVRFDGLVFQDLHHRDGLVGDTVHDVIQDRDGDFWITTDSGVSRYRASTVSPSVHLTEVVADRSYGTVEELSLPSTQGLIQLSFQGSSFTTSLERMVYVYRLQGYEDDWKPTRSAEVRYSDLPAGRYVFEVKAVDRDLNYSDPVALSLTIHPSYRQLALIGGLCLALMGLVAVSGYALRKRHALFVEMEEELQTAHEMQMSLMPAAPPHIEGLDIAGRCLPANHVGGDLFQYFRRDGRLTVCMADVTGHAMEAAVPVMMFSGVLKSQMELGDPIDALFQRLNRTLHATLQDRTFVCFALGELELRPSPGDGATRALRLSNSGCPYPYHFCAATGEVSELQVDAYPLGVRSDTVYPTIEVPLEPGDRVLFCSDGIVEMGNADGEFFGFERTAETIRQGCLDDLSAEGLIDRLVDAARGFAAGASQEDDMTCIVVRIESARGGSSATA